MNYSVYGSIFNHLIRAEDANRYILRYH